MTETAKNKDESYVDKIRKLLRKAENNPNEHEADAFLKKAQELMLLHAIDEETLWKNDPSRRAKIDKIRFKIPDKQSGAQWDRILLNKIAHLHNCKMWYTPRLGISYVAGFPNDLIFVEMLYKSIMVQKRFKMAFAQAFNENIHHKTLKTNFSAGFTNRLCERLDEFNRAAHVEHVPTGGSMAIALVDRSKAVEAWVSQHANLGRAKPMTSSSYNAQARAAGAHAANQTDISGGRRNVTSGRKALPQ